jgi:hypothetical protein
VIRSRSTTFDNTSLCIVPLDFRIDWEKQAVTFPRGHQSIR